MGKNVFIAVVIFLILSILMFGYSIIQYNKTQVQLAHYIASINPNLPCDKKAQDDNK